VLISAILVPLTIGEIKNITNIPCPKDIYTFGGMHSYTRIIGSIKNKFRHDENLRCFPAAHASGGFAFLSCFFLFKSARNRKIALVSAMAVGWSMGVYKMLIGDHFLSHTIVSMISAWLIILLVKNTTAAYSYDRKMDVLQKTKIN